MPVSQYKDLIVWQLADELRREVYRLTASGPASKDFQFRDQLYGAVRKLAPNIAEGFRRSTNADFARFVTYAYAGAAEVSDWLDDGESHGYWPASDLFAARRLLKRLDAGLRAFLRHLNGSKTRGRTHP
jgi:four helix bundle protein